ncbi:hypothetical protein Taro_038664, partial [Colocasia esculenta]|nr:hypothetical protein [Colocasia esculenta]
LRQLSSVLFLSRSNPEHVSTVWPLILHLAPAASTLPAAPEPVGNQQGRAKTAAPTEQRAVVVSYWGVPPSKFTKEDAMGGVCKADVSIDLKKHHFPVTFLDKMAFWTVKSLRWPTDLFFQRRYGCRATMLETVAAVPGMVGGSNAAPPQVPSPLRAPLGGGGSRSSWRNERMHQMTFME